MNVEQLRRVLADLPGDVPVVIEDSKTGWMQNAALYLAPAHIDRRISGNYLYAHHRDSSADNCHVLLISGFGQSDEGFVDISPQSAWPKVVDAEADIPQPCGSGDLHPINPATRERCEPSDEAQSNRPQHRLGPEDR